jgi:hypothetical protein
MNTEHHHADPSSACTWHTGAIPEAWDGAYVEIEQFLGGLLDESGR